MGGKFIEGVVEEGLGEGKLFMSLDHYKKEIKGKLGFDAFEGTLNIKVNNSDLKLLNNPIKIEGFEKDNKKFYGVDCYKAKIKDIDGAVIIPELSRHKDTIEFIAPVHLKSELNIKDGDKIKIELK
jgi:riboflavin kinase|tara:strand:+ start:666 stop:1043 length:378 start_codon:yes stop_codon:yes gene_type:complete